MPLDRIGSATAFLALFVGLAWPLCPQAGQTSQSSKVSGWSGKDLAVIVNDNDKLSAQIADYYQKKRAIPASQIIHIRLRPNVPDLSPEQFNTIRQQVGKQTPAHVQGYVLTWTMPFRVQCMSITTAFAAGFDQAFCAKGCKETRHNPYFDSASHRPFDDFGWRPTMVLAADNLGEARQLIDRGMMADSSQPKGNAYLLKTSDSARSSRAALFPSCQSQLANQLPISYLQQDFIQNKPDVMFYFTGLSRVPKLDSNRYLPGAVADHLTSGGGILRKSYQMSIMEWLRAGVTGSYGAVVEPCNFPEKFPHPGVLMAHYLGGDTLIEAYWKSVAQPGQGIFVGEPLARPYAK